MAHPDPILDAVAHNVAAATGTSPGRLPYLQAYRQAYALAGQATDGDLTLAQYLADLDAEIARRQPQEGKFFGRSGQLMAWLRGTPLTR